LFRPRSIWIRKVVQWFFFILIADRHQPQSGRKQVEFLFSRAPACTRSALLAAS
jgi:hypothetical protein